MRIVEAGLLLPLMACTDAGTETSDTGCAPWDDRTWYRDRDADGYGRLDETQVGCQPPSGFVAWALDCDDTSSAVSPGATEVCNGLDDDCDGVVDDDATNATAWRLDADGDGWGDDLVGLATCERPSNYVSAGGDCDDDNPLVHPGATETCGDAADEDCNGVICP